MFDIEYKGGNCIVLTSKGINVVIDPALALIGLKDIKIKDSIELLTDRRFFIDNPDARLVIDGPGEYEIGNFTIRGVAMQRHTDTEAEGKLSTAYRIEVGDVRCAVIGNIAPNLDDEQLEDIGVVDIVVIPVGGGGYTLDAMSAAEVIRQIEPKVVIPIHYADGVVKYEVPQEGIEAFLKEISGTVEETARYKVKNAATLPQALTTVKLARTS